MYTSQLTEPRRHSHRATRVPHARRGSTAYLWLAHLGLAAGALSWPLGPPSPAAPTKHLKSSSIRSSPASSSQFCGSETVTPATANERLHDAASTQK